MINRENMYCTLKALTNLRGKGWKLVQAHTLESCRELRVPAWESASQTLDSELVELGETWGGTKGFEGFKAWHESG